MDKSEFCNIDDFGKLNIKIVTIEQAEKLEKSRNLLKLTVNIGPKKRVLVAGIASTHEPEELIKKQVPVLVNLQPKKIMGVKSQGMLMAVENDGEAVLLYPEKKVEAGAAVR